MGGFEAKGHNNAAVMRKQAMHIVCWILEPREQLRMATAGRAMSGIAKIHPELDTAAVGVGYHDCVVLLECIVAAATGNDVGH